MTRATNLTLALVLLASCGATDQQATPDAGPGGCYPCRFTPDMCVWTADDCFRCSCMPGGSASGFTGCVDHERRSCGVWSSSSDAGVALREFAPCPDGGS